MKPRSSPSRATLRDLDLQPIHIARNATKADVFRFEWPPASGEYAVVKDLRARPLWFRLVLGRLSLAREWRALRALEGVAGVPKPLARLDRDAFVMQWRAGTPAMHLAPERVSPAVLERVARLLDEAHARGVSHGDLHRNNILIGDDGEVTLIDWATACVFGPRPRPPKGWTWREWQSLDARALAKLKARHAPHLVTPRERNLLLHGSPLYRLVRSAGWKLRQSLGLTAGKTPRGVAARYEKWLDRAQKPADSPDVPTSDSPATPNDDASSQAPETSRGASRPDDTGSVPTAPAPATSPRVSP